MKSCVSLQRAVAVVVPLRRFVRSTASEAVDQIAPNTLLGCAEGRGEDTAPALEIVL